MILCWKLRGMIEGWCLYHLIGGSPDYIFSLNWHRQVTIRGQMSLSCCHVNVIVGECWRLMPCVSCQLDSVNPITLLFQWVFMKRKSQSLIVICSHQVAPLDISEIAGQSSWWAPYVVEEEVASKAKGSGNAGCLEHQIWWESHRYSWVAATLVIVSTVNICHVVIWPNHSWTLSMKAFTFWRTQLMSACDALVD